MHLLKANCSQRQDNKTANRTGRHQVHNGHHHHHLKLSSKTMRNYGENLSFTEHNPSTSCYIK
jgi:hypothetical protein